MLLHLKNLEYDNPEVRQHMLEAFSYWVRDFGIDGFRGDVGWAYAIVPPSSGLAGANS